MLAIKILGIRPHERYIVRRLVLSAWQELLPRYPGLRVDISEVEDAIEVGKVASALIQPSLMVGEKIVCRGRIPTREEVLAWLEKAIEAGASASSEGG